jgi:hypothetical protein
LPASPPPARSDRQALALRREPLEHPVAAVALDDAVDEPVLAGLFGLEEASRSMSARTRCSLWPVRLALSSSIRWRVLRISVARISTSVAWPSKPAVGSWMRMRELGSAIRLPFAPPGRQQRAHRHPDADAHRVDSGAVGADPVVAREPQFRCP